jgi:hypothetical protein
MTTLQDIARELAIKYDTLGNSNEPKFLLFGRDAIRELNLANTLNIKSVLLDIDPSNMTVVLPDDYVTYTKVGLLVGNRILELDYDSRIYPKEKEIDLCDDGLTPENRFKRDCDCLCSGGALPYRFHYLWYYRGRGQTLFTDYAVPVYYGTKFFRIHNGIIYLDSICPIEQSQIVLEYKTTGVSNGGETPVPDLFRAAVSAYIEWKAALTKGANNVLILHQEYKRQFKLVERIKRSSTLLEILRAVRSSKGQAVSKN